MGWMVISELRFKITNQNFPYANSLFYGVKDAFTFFHSIFALSNRFAEGRDL